jgi:hypothetical protein
MSRQTETLFGSTIEEQQHSKMIQQQNLTIYSSMTNKKKICELPDPDIQNRPIATTSAVSCWWTVDVMAGKICKSQAKSSACTVPVVRHALVLFNLPSDMMSLCLGYSTLFCTGYSVWLIQKVKVDVGTKSLVLYCTRDWCVPCAISMSGAVLFPVICQARCSPSSPIKAVIMTKTCIPFVTTVITTWYPSVINSCPYWIIAITMCLIHFAQINHLA